MHTQQDKDETARTIRRCAQNAPRKNHSQVHIHLDNNNKIVCACVTLDEREINGVACPLFVEGNLI